MRQKRDIWQRFGDCTRQRISSAHARDLELGMWVYFLVGEARCNLDVFDHLQEIWPASQKRVIHVARQHSGKRIDICMIEVHLRQCRIIGR